MTVFVPCNDHENFLGCDNDGEDMDGDDDFEDTNDVAADDDVRDDREGDGDVGNEYGKRPVKDGLVVISSRLVKLFI